MKSMNVHLYNWFPVHESLPARHSIRMQIVIFFHDVKIDDGKVGELKIYVKNGRFQGRWDSSTNRIIDELNV